MIEPQPLSKTAKGGNKIDKSTRQKLKILFFSQKKQRWVLKTQLTNSKSEKGL